MGLRLTQKPTFTTKVECDIANDKGGFDRVVFNATFKRASVQESQALSEMSLNADVIRSQIVGWSDVLDDDGNQVPFSAEALEGMLQIAAVIKPLASAFWTGNTGAKRGN